MIETEIELAGAVDATSFAQEVQHSLPAGCEVTISSLTMTARAQAGLRGVGTPADFESDSEKLLQFRQGVANTVGVQVVDVSVDRVGELQYGRRQLQAEDGVELSYIVVTANATTASQVAATMSDTQTFSSLLAFNFHLHLDAVTARDAPDFTTIIELEVMVPSEDGVDANGTGESANEAAALSSLQDTQTLASAANMARAPGTSAVQVLVASSSVASHTPSRTPSPPPRSSLLTSTTPPRDNMIDDEAASEMGSTILAIFFGCVLSLFAIVGVVFCRVKLGTLKSTPQKSLGSSSAPGSFGHDDSFGGSTMNMMRVSGPNGEGLDAFDTDNVVDSTYRRSLAENSGRSGGRYVSPLMAQGEMVIERSPMASSTSEVEIEPSPVLAINSNHIHQTPPTTPTSRPGGERLVPLDKEEPVVPNRDYRP